jgi:hypothetical protein
VKVRLLILLGTILSFQSAHAFRYQRCMDGAVNRRYVGGWITSTTQFSSSWGPCTMIGAKPSEQRFLFVGSEIDNIQMDAARGGGEYADALATLYGCDPIGISAFGPAVQSRYSAVFRNTYPLG